MTLFHVQYPLHHQVHALYGRSEKEVMDVLEQLRNPSWNLPKPPEHPLLKPTREYIDCATLLFDYGGKYSCSVKPLECMLSPDFKIQIRPESLETFLLSQPYFCEVKVGNLYLIAD